jgi:hypothetical protein
LSPLPASAPAFVSTDTSTPDAINRFTVAGTSATRDSPPADSLGTNIFMFACCRLKDVWRNNLPPAANAKQNRALIHRGIPLKPRRGIFQPRESNPEITYIDRRTQNVILIHA